MRIQVLENIVTFLIVLLMRFAPFKPSGQPLDWPYRKFQVDPMPVIKTIEIQDYRKLLAAHSERTGKVLKPVKRRKPSTVPKTLICPYCHAPHEYLYDNNGGRGQFQCKVCSHRFDINKTKVSFFCPFCGRALEHKKSRKQFNIHKCINDRCQFYQNNLAALSREEYELYQHEPFRFKLRYIYREFITDFKPLQRAVHMPEVKDL